MPLHNSRGIQLTECQRVTESRFPGFGESTFCNILICSELRDTGLAVIFGKAVNRGFDEAGDCDAFF